jgi:rubrerythrin
MGDGEDTEEVTYWVCGACGHTHVGDEPPERCPVCNALAKGYMKVV